MSDSRCWLLCVYPNEPDSWPTMVRVFTDHDHALGEVARLNVALELLRDLTEEFRKSVERFEQSAARRVRWHDDPAMQAQYETLGAAVKQFEEREGFRFEPNYGWERNHDWQPSLELEELRLVTPLNP